MSNIFFIGRVSNGEGVQIRWPENSKVPEVTTGGTRIEPHAPLRRVPDSPDIRANFVANEQQQQHHAPQSDYHPHPQRQDDYSTGSTTPSSYISSPRQYPLTETYAPHHRGITYYTHIFLPSNLNTVTPRPTSILRSHGSVSRNSTPPNPPHSVAWGPHFLAAIPPYQSSMLSYDSLDTLRYA